jgi:hypothetical protein
VAEGREGLNRPVADSPAILRALVDGEVEFLVAGGVAVQAHGYVRVTVDLDIIPEPSAPNMRRLAEVLQTLDAKAVDDRGRTLPMDLSHPESLAVGNYFLTTNAGALDVFNGPRPDLHRYRDLDARAIPVDFERTRFRVIGLDDLIRMKREAGRDKDLSDIAALTEVERHRKRATGAG